MVGTHCSDETSVPRWPIFASSASYRIDGESEAHKTPLLFGESTVSDMYTLRTKAQQDACKNGSRNESKTRYFILNEPKEALTEKKIIMIIITVGPSMTGN